jgi:hypothetical protein
MSTDDDKISSLYHEAGGTAPPRALDDAILSASRAAVEQRHAAKSPFSGGWRAAASIAAVIVITVILVPILKQEDPQPPSTQPLQRTAAPAQHEEEALPAAGLSSAARKRSSNAAPPASAPALLQDSPLSAFQTVPTPISAESGIEALPDADEASYLEKEKALAGPDTTGHKPSRMQAADSAPFAINTPEMWEARISQLIARGEMEQARAELERLKEHYPDYSINPSIPEKLQ